jgi:hypothetical protein
MSAAAAPSSAALGLRQPQVLRSTSRVFFRAAMSATDVLRRLSAGVGHWDPPFLTPQGLLRKQTLNPISPGANSCLGELLRRAGLVRLRPGVPQRKKRAIRNLMFPARRHVVSAPTGSTISGQITLTRAELGSSGPAAPHGKP